MHRPDLDDIVARALSGRDLLQHPFYRRWEAGELHPAELSAYAGQYRHFERALPAVLGAVVGTLPDGAARQLVQANLDDERAVPAPHIELFEAFADAVGAAVQTPASAATEALLDCYRAAVDAGPAEALATIAAYEVQAPAVATSKAEGLRLRYGLSEAQTRFWDVHGVMDEEHAAWTLDALGALDPDAAVVHRAVRGAADAWWAFLDEREDAAVALAG